MHQLHTGPWDITEAPGHKSAKGGGLRPHKWHKALQDPVNNEKTPDQKPPLDPEAHEEEREENTLTETVRVQTSRGAFVQGPSAEGPS